MTAPALAAKRFMLALAAGGGLGICYGFLRPSRKKAPHLSDALFVLATFYGWIYVGFGLCEGDLRFGYTLAMLLGALVWEISIGRILRPVFSWIWKIFVFFFLPAKKALNFSLKICKKVLANWKKWVTMGRNIGRIRQRYHTKGGAAYGKTQISSGSSQDQSPGQSGDPDRYRIVYHCAGDAARHH